MKIKTEHYNQIKAAMEKIKDKIPAHIEYLKRSENLSKIKNFDMRVRWDWFYVAIINNFTFLFNKELYSYLNDDNIDSALKKIVGEIGVK